jgi:hypothetical protein
MSASPTGFRRWRPISANSVGNAMLALRDASSRPLLAVGRPSEHVVDRANPERRAVRRPEP